MIAMLAGCFKGETGATGPAGEQGIQGAKGDSGAIGATGPAGTVIHVLSGYLTTSNKSTNGNYWIIYNVWNSAAPLASVYVRINASYVWWTPAYYIEPTGDIRILNSQATGSVAATDLTNYEYRIIVAQF